MDWGLVIVMIEVVTALEQMSFAMRRRLLGDGVARPYFQHGVVLEHERVELWLVQKLVKQFVPMLDDE